MGLMDLLENALRGGDPTSPFDAVAPNARREDLAHGVSAALRSDQAPPCGDRVANLFGQSDPDQRAGLLNRIIGALAPPLSAAF